MKVEKVLGIDIGKHQIHVSQSSPQDPRKWEVTVIEMSESTWREELATLAQDAAAVAIESTGYHYSAPIFDAVAHLQCYEVNGHTTKHIRASRIAATKDDFNDARALALIAQDTLAGQEIRGVQPRNNDAITLRLLVNERHNLNKILLRITNRAEQLAYSIDPAFSHHRTAFIHCLSGKVFKRDEVEALANSMSRKAHKTREALLKLAADLPEVMPTRTIGMLTRAADHMNLINAHISEIEPQIISIIESVPFTALWRTVPYISDWGIAAYLVVCNLNPLTMTKSQFKRALGVAPNTAQSGKVTKTAKTPGYKPAKALLHLHAIKMVSVDNPIADYYNTMQGRKPFFAAKRKIAELLYTLAYHNKPYDPSKGRKVVSDVMPDLQ